MADATRRLRKSRTRFLCVLVVTSSIVAASTGCGDRDPAAGAPVAAEPPQDLVDRWAEDTAEGEVLRATTIAQLPELGTDLVARPGDGDLYVATRSGLVYRIDRGHESGHTVPVIEPDAVLDLRADITTEGERGLLGLEFDRTGDHLVTVSTALDGSVEVRSFAMSEGGRPDPASVRTLGSIPHPFAGHNGGDIVRLHDGSFLVSVGDMDTGASEVPAAQDDASLLGSVLHVPERLLSGTAGAGWEDSVEIVAKGLRNPWRISLDRISSDVWIGDVGADAVEEIDLIPVDVLDQPSRWPLNFGWPWFEGSGSTGTGTPNREVTMPVHEYDQGEGLCGIVLGPVLEVLPVDGAGPQVVFGDLCSSAAWALATDGSGVVNRIVDLAAPPISFGFDGSQAYVLDSTGAVLRLDPAPWQVEHSTASVSSDVEEIDRPAPPTALCALVSGFEELNTDRRLEPSEFRAKALGLRNAWEDLAGFVGAQPDVDPSPVAAVVSAIVEVGEQVGWQRDHPDFTALEERVGSGVPPFEGFGTSLAQLQDLRQDVCGDGSG